MIQQQLQSRLKWAGKVRSNSEGHARKMQKIAAKVYKKLGEEDREIASLRQLQEQNFIRMSELECAQWQKLYEAEEEEDTEEVAESPEMVTNRGELKKKSREDRRRGEA